MRLSSAGRRLLAIDERDPAASAIHGCFDLGMDLSRNFPAPLTAYYAQKENNYGKESYSGI